MKVSDFPEEAQPIASAVLRYFKKKKMQPIKAWVWQGSPYKINLCADNSGVPFLVEAQGNLDYHGVLKGFVRWFQGQRNYGEIYIATSDKNSLPAEHLKEISKDGIGLLLVDKTRQVTVQQKARNPALVVSPDPTLKYGDVKNDVLDSIKKFNETNRKDGLRDLCEIFEKEIKRLLESGIRKGHLNIPLSSLSNMDLSGMINTLYSSKAYISGKQRLIDDNLHHDLHSFRGARNLVDHPAPNKREKRRVEQQFVDRMTAGPRLISNLYYLRLKL